MQNLNVVSKHVNEALLSESPDFNDVVGAVERMLDLPQADLLSLIRKVVLNLNLQLFPAITQLELIHTEGCNLGCSYCFEKNMLGYKKMSREVAKAAVDLLFDYSGLETNLRIVHFGGEPTLNFSAIKFVTEYAEKRAKLEGKNIKFDMTSNGVLITEEMANYFAEHKIMVLLSIDGLKETHDKFRKDKFGNGSFEKAIQGFRILKQKQRWMGTKMTVMPQNVSALFEDVKGLYELGFNQFTIGHATGFKWSDEDINSFSTQYSKIFRWYKEKPREDLRIDDLEDNNPSAFFGCQAGRNSVSIAVNGEISPCSKILALNNKVLLSKLGDVQFGLTHLKNRMDLVDCSKLITSCKTLGIDKEYQGGCFVTNFNENGDIFIPSIQEHTITMKKISACSGCSSCHN